VKANSGDIHLRSCGSLFELWNNDPGSCLEAKHLLTIHSHYLDDLIEALRQYREQMKDDADA